MYLFGQFLYRNFCQKTTKKLKTIYISKSTDIFTNLALEDWLYKNNDFSNLNLLMLWQSMPCIVIGRHQNPWIECNFSILSNHNNNNNNNNSDVKLARRNSGGGTVYHDMGNLNLTFFTNRKDYCRKRNLELISRSLNRSFGLKSVITSREDLCINGYKISGTASKLGRNNAYHHCTILINVNKNDLSLALKNSLESCICITNATRSVKTDIMNLNDKIPTINIEQVMQAIINEFNTDDINSNIKIIDKINDSQYPGISDIKNELLSDLWRYKKTPKFEILQTIHLLEDNNNNNNSELVKAFLIIEHGTICDAGIKYKNTILSSDGDKIKYLNDIFNELINKDFSYDILKEFNMIVCGLRNSGMLKDFIINTG